MMKTKRNIEKKKRRTELHSRYKTILTVDSQSIPSLQLEGLWLEDAGFWRGDRVKVKVSPNCIVITPEKTIRKNAG